MKKQLTVLAAILAIALGLSACTPASHAPSGDSLAAPGVAAPAHPEMAQSPVGLDEAVALVLDRLGISEAELTEQKYEQDKGIYDLEFTANGVEYDIDVDSTTGEILKAEQEPADDPAPSVPVKPAAISLDEAKAIVFAHLGISEADTHDRDFALEDGKFELSFQVGNLEYEVYVSLMGEILHIEKEADDDHRDDPPAAPTTPAAITLEQAKAIVFAHLGISEADTHDRDFALEDGKFELSFQVGNLEYEVDVSLTGQILHIEKEIDD